MNAEAIFLKYTDRYDRSNGKIELKILHTLEVAKVMDRLTKKLHLDGETCEMAHICAVFHDIGRFEQVRRYDTFLDHLSVDHAELGCEVLKQEGFLAELPEAEAADDSDSDTESQPLPDRTGTGWSHRVFVQADSGRRQM